MSGNLRRASLKKIVKLGRMVDPIIVAALRKNSSAEFRSSVTYHFQGGGKRVRSAITILSCLACGGTLQDALGPAAVVEMIHNYSLVMDDIIDHAAVRRGKPTVRVHEGESVALLVAMQYREVMEDIIQECPRSAEVRRAAVETMKEIIEGERLDLLLEQAGRSDPYLIAHQFGRPSFKLYLDMIGEKTASLFKTASAIGASSAGAPRRTVSGLGSYGWNAGLAFQVMDDVLDIFGTTTGKQPAKDIIEHKLGNAVVMMAMKFLPQPDRMKLQRILTNRVISRRVAESARHMIEKTPAERASREVAEAYLKAAQASLAVLGRSNYARELAELAEQLALRTY